MTQSQYSVPVLLALAALLAACSREEPAATAPPPLSVRQFDAASLRHGAELFAEHCAQCHGPEGQGHPDWQTPSGDQFAAAPPLNGTGNDWKRTRAQLAAVIRDGARRATDKAEIMPSWKGRLKEPDIEDVINYMQSLWPADIYEAWSKAQATAPVPKG